VAVAFRLPSVLAPRENGERSPLALVPKAERRYVRVFVVVGALFVSMGCVVALHVHMAHQQMKIDSMNYDISRARMHFDSLRAERATLQSPEKLIESARGMGMVPSQSTRIIDIPASIAAEVAGTVGKVDADVVSSEESQLDEFGRLKPAVVGAP
jgi:cell division protein FtsL